MNDKKKSPRLLYVVIKVILGLFVIIVNADNPTHDITQLFIGVVIGGAIIAWGLVPYIAAKKRERQEAMIRYYAPMQEEEEKDEAELLAEKYYNK